MMLWVEHSTAHRRRACKRARTACLLFCCWAWNGAFNHAQAADAMHKLSGPDIRKALAGKMLTDYAHWGETYQRNGKLRIDNNGIISSGTWTVENNHLCKKIPNVLSECYEMWVDHDQVELRQANLPTFEAYIRNP